MDKKRVFNSTLCLFVVMLYAGCLLLDTTAIFLHLSFLLLAICFQSMLHDQVAAKITKIFASRHGKYVRENTATILLAVSLCAFKIWASEVSLFKCVQSVLIPGTTPVMVLLALLLVFPVDQDTFLFTCLLVLVLVWFYREVSYDKKEGNVTINKKVDFFIDTEKQTESMDSLRVGAPLIYGLLIMPMVLLAVAFFIYWSILSINFFWMDEVEPSKFSMLSAIGSEYNLDATRITSIEDALSLPTNLFPVIIKPNVCTTSSVNVVRCEDMNCLREYMDIRQQNRITRLDDTSWIVQRAVNSSEYVEVVVFFYRYPYFSTGSIKTIGIRTKARETDYYSSRASRHLEANYFFTESRNDLITRELTQKMNDIANRKKGYYGGRFDIMVKNLEDLKEGKGLNILEANLMPLGCIEEKQPETWYNFARQVRTFILQLWIGIANILGGYHNDPIKFIEQSPRLYERYFQCQNHESLWDATT